MACFGFRPPPVPATRRLPSSKLCAHLSHAGAGLDRVRGGFVYIPQRCRTRGAHCRVHVFAHGCGMAANAGYAPRRLYAFNDTYARRAGFNEVAEVRHSAS